MSKQYGLILPNKNKPQLKQETVLKRPSIFDEDSDSDTQVTKKPMGFKKALKRQDKVAQDRALEEDPTVFQYDEVYDEMDKKRKDSKSAKKDVEKKPKYINMLLAAADRRKKENERRIEREVQKEREAEGEMYKDKDAFVTSAYKKKLEERKILEEQEKREAYLEAIGNVENQGNLDGFYRHFYEQKVKSEEDDDKVKVKEEVKDEVSSRSGSEDDETKVDRSPKITSKHSSKRTSSSQSDDDEKHDSDNKRLKVTKKPTAKNRKYRKHESSESEASDVEQKVEETKKEHLPSNLDADSDFSIDSSDSEDDESGKNVHKKKELEEAKKGSEAVEDSKNTVEKVEAKTDVEKKEDKKTNVDKPQVKTEPEEPAPKKPKIDIWKKRTLGEVYEAALQRYFMRKAMRESQQL